MDSAPAAKAPVPTPPPANNTTADAASANISTVPSATLAPSTNKSNNINNNNAATSTTIAQSSNPGTTATSPVPAPTTATVATKLHVNVNASATSSTTYHPLPLTAVAVPPVGVLNHNANHIQQPQQPQPSLLYQYQPNGLFNVANATHPNIRPQTPTLTNHPQLLQQDPHKHIHPLQSPSRPLPAQYPVQQNSPMTAGNTCNTTAMGSVGPGAQGGQTGGMVVPRPSGQATVPSVGVPLPNGVGMRAPASTGQIVNGSQHVQSLAQPQTAQRSQPHQPVSAPGPYVSPVQRPPEPDRAINDGTPALASHSTAPRPPTEEYTTQIRQQMLAYKLLSKNCSLPPHLQQAALKYSTDNTTGNPSESIQSPSMGSKLVKNALHYSDYMSKEKKGSDIPSWRVITPSQLPPGLDHYAMAEEQERVMNLRIKQRIAELQSMPSTLPNGGGMIGAHTGDATVDVPCLKESKRFGGSIENAKLQALVELKGLKLLGKQRKLREEIVSGAQRTAVLLSSADRTAFRRAKRPAVREARLTERLERAQRAEKERKEKQKHSAFLHSVITHAREMSSFHARQRNRIAKFGRTILQFHAKAEKEEQVRKQRISQERLKALRADDEEAYMKLIDQTKDTRITQLLRQTDSYLENLSNAVVQQKGAVIPIQDTILQDDMDEELELVGENGKPVDYFKICHRIQEEVSAQPAILVGGTLKDYQLKGLQWMLSLYNNRLNGILADEMGLGKTIQTISLITTLIERKNQAGPFLIIVPLSTLTNWVIEFEKWAPSVVLVVFKGGPNVRKQIEREQIRPGKFNVLITTYEFIIKDRSVLSKVHWIHTIIDEGHRMKNANSKLSQTLTMHYHTKYRLILTGTPLQNNLPELWALLNFILPKVFNSVKSFDEWFSAPFAGSGIGRGDEKMELNEEESLLIIKRLHKVLRPFLLRRLKKDVESELPDKVERVVKCKMSALQRKLYDQMRKYGSLVTESVTEGKTGSFTGIKGLNNTIMQLRKICNHPFVFSEIENAINPSRVTDDLIWRTSGKFELLDRMLTKLRATGHRVLMFFQMTMVMSIFEDFLQFRGMKYLRLDGSTKADERSQLLSLFNSPNSEYFIFILSTRAGGMGLNLQTADTVIIFDSDWNPHQDLQAQDRAHRIGQTKEVLVFRLITSRSVEEQILARAQYKLDMDGKVIQAGKFDNKSTPEERERFLRELLENDADNKDDLDEDDELKNDDMNEMLARNEGELDTFKSLDEMYFRSLPDRLLTEPELPEFYAQDLEELRKAAQEANDDNGSGTGRSSRKRGNEVELLMAEDGMTEDQWLDAIENADYKEQLAKKYEKRMRKLERREEKRRLQLEQVKKRKDKNDSDNASMTSSRGSRRGRPRKHQLPEDKESEEDEEGTPGPRKKPRFDDQEAPVRDAVREAGRKIWEAISNLEEEGTGRVRSSLFAVLPSRKEYPGYYMEIKKPISLRQIRRRIEQQKYGTFETLLADFNLMTTNAKTFNQEGSEVYEDAEVIAAEVQRLASLYVPQVQAGLARARTDARELASSVEDANRVQSISVFPVEATQEVVRSLAQAKTGDAPLDPLRPPSGVGAPSSSVGLNKIRLTLSKTARQQAGVSPPTANGERGRAPEPPGCG